MKAIKVKLMNGKKVISAEYFYNSFGLESYIRTSAEKLNDKESLYIVMGKIYSTEIPKNIDSGELDSLIDTINYYSGEYIKV